MGCPSPRRGKSPGPQRRPLGELSNTCECLAGAGGAGGVSTITHRNSPCHCRGLRVELEGHEAQCQHLPMPTLGSLVLRPFPPEAISETFSFLGLPFQMAANNWHLFSHSSGGQKSEHPGAGGDHAPPEGSTRESLRPPAAPASPGRRPSACGRISLSASAFPLLLPPPSTNFSPSRCERQNLLFQ